MNWQLFLNLMVGFALIAAAYRLGWCHRHHLSTRRHSAANERMIRRQRDEARGEVCRDYPRF